MIRNTEEFFVQIIMSRKFWDEKREIPSWVARWKKAGDFEEIVLLYSHEVYGYKCMQLQLYGFSLFPSLGCIYSVGTVGYSYFMFLFFLFLQ